MYAYFVSLICSLLLDRDIIVYISEVIFYMLHEVFNRDILKKQSVFMTLNF